jgi:Protein of unknown function (DUF3352)
VVKKHLLLGSIDRMKVRSFFSTLILISLALLVVGVGGFIGLTSRSPLALLAQGGQGVPAATIFVPKQAPAMVSLLTRPDRLSDLWLLLAKPERRRQTQVEIARLETSLLAGSGLTYADDIQPWLGSEVTFAVTTADLDQDADNGQQPGYLLALSCRDSERAKAALELFWQKRAIAGDSLVFEQFAGSKLIYSQPRAGAAAPAVASAVVSQKFVLLANSPAVLQQALTSGQSSDLNLEQAAGYRKALAALPDQRIGLAVVNLPAALGWLGLAEQPVSFLSDRLGQADGVIDQALVSLRTHRQGLLADTALLAAPGHPFAPVQLDRVLDRSAVTEAASYLPAGTPLAAVGSQLDQLWQAISRTLPYYVAAVPAWQPLWQQLQAPLAQRSAADLVDWVEADYALGLVGRSTPHGAGWVLAAQADPSALAKFDQLAQQQGLSVGPLRLNDQLVSAWTRLSIAGAGAGSDLAVSTEVVGLHTQSDRYQLLSNSAAALYSALMRDRSLLASPQWQQTTAPLDLPNTGYVYCDWQSLKPDFLAQAPWLRLVDQLAQPLLSHLQTLAATSYGQDEAVQRGGIFLRLTS